MNEFPDRLRGFSALVFAAAGVAAAVLARSEGMPPVWPLVIFGALVLFSQHRAVILPNGVSISSNFMVTMTLVVVFSAHSSLLGPLLLGMLGGVYAPDFRRRRWPWIPFNAGVLGLALLAAAAAYQVLPRSLTTSLPLAMVGAVVPAALIAGVSSILITVSYAIEGGVSLREKFAELMSGNAQLLVFAEMGLLLGRLYLDLGPAVMLLIIVPILIAREMFASYLRVKVSHDETVQMLIRALEQKDPYTAGHAGRVATYANYIAEEMQFMPARAERLRFAALMHDIGKLVVPNQLLNKPGKLTEEEYKRVRVHEGVSVQMLSHIDFLRPIAPTTHSDNMRFDPDDPDHPIEPYIIMIADAYDAMTSTRSYRKALPQEVAFQELRDKSGTQFHPEAAAALIRAIERRNLLHGAGHEEKSHFEDAPDAGLGSAGLGDLLPDEADAGS